MRQIKVGVGEMTLKQAQNYLKKRTLKKDDNKSKMSVYWGEVPITKQK